MTPNFAPASAIPERAIPGFRRCAGSGLAALKLQGRFVNRRRVRIVRGRRSRTGHSIENLHRIAALAENPRLPFSPELHHSAVGRVQLIDRAVENLASGFANIDMSK